MSKSETYAQRILAILQERSPISIHDLRAEFDKTPTAQSGVSSALINARDRGEVRITGGGHSNSVKMIALIPAFTVPKGRIVRLSDKTHWHRTEHKSSGVAIQSSVPNLMMFGG